MKRILLGVALASFALGTYFALPPPRDAQAQGVAALSTGKSGDPLPTLAAVVGGAGFNGTTLTGRFNCDKVAAVPNLGTTATVQAIAGVAGQNIYVCGIVMLASTAGGTTTISFTEGTGSNCATGAASVGSAFLNTSTTAASGSANVSWSQAVPSRYTATAGDALCVTQGQAVNATVSSGLIFYTQN